MSRADVIVFVVAGSAGLRDAVCASLPREGLKLVPLDSAADYLRQPDPGLPSCLILGLDLPDMSGPELQARIAHTGASIVFVSERVDLPQSVRAIKAGAIDFLTTPIDAGQLTQALQSAVELDRCRRARLARLGELQRRYRALTPRECEVLPLITDGMLNKQVASVMGISPMTVQIHRGRIMRKMAARSFADLVRIADALTSGSTPGVPHRPARRPNAIYTSRLDTTLQASTETTMINAIAAASRIARSTR
jgi:FixJ family two-component response regulator